jgi:hypothetical protein
VPFQVVAGRVSIREAHCCGSECASPRSQYALEVTSGPVGMEDTEPWFWNHRSTGADFDFETPNVYMSYNKAFFLAPTLRYDWHGRRNTLHCRGPRPIVARIHSVHQLCGGV